MSEEVFEASGFPTVPTPGVRSFVRTRGRSNPQGEKNQMVHAQATGLVPGKMYDFV